jgi:hypothetical protein
MRRISIVRACFNRFPLFRLARPVVMALLVLVYAAPTPAAERIAVFPATPYDGMKLREIERIQEMGEDREESNAPLLE